MPEVFYIAVGSELLEGAKSEENGKYLSCLLEERGGRLIGELIVRDDAGDLTRALDFAFSSSADTVVVSGGLGPTDDDITREIIARWCERKLVFREECWERIVEKFRKRGYPVPERNRKEAEIPAGFQLIDNPVGSACGFTGEVKGKRLIVLPGVPSEFRAMVENVFPEKAAVETIKLDIRMYGIPESYLNDLLAPVIEEFKEAKFTFLPEFPEVYLRVRGKGDQDLLRSELERLIGKYVYTWEGKPLAVVFGEELKRRGLFFAVAESCTGGLVAKSITDIPGSSNYFDRGFVTYSNQAKMDHLGVKKETLEKYGAVSEQTAREMVEGVLANSNADIAASITGIAGPTGGTPEKPVGTVYTAIADREGRIEVVRNFFPGNREQVRTQTMVKVLFGVIKWVERFYPE